MAPCLYGREQIGPLWPTNQSGRASLLFAVEPVEAAAVVGSGIRSPLGRETCWRAIRLARRDRSNFVGDFQECLPDERIGRLGRALARFDAATPISLRLREHLDRPSPTLVEGNTFGPEMVRSLGTHPSRNDPLPIVSKPPHVAGVPGHGGRRRLRDSGGRWSRTSTSDIRMRSIWGRFRRARWLPRFSSWLRNVRIFCPLRHPPLACVPRP